MIGRCLTELREKKGLTKKAVAEYLRMTPEGYSYYESGKRKPSPEVIAKLADFFEVSADYLLGRTNYPKANEPAEDIRFENLNYAFFEGMPEDLTEEEKERIVEFARFAREERKKRK